MNPLSFQEELELSDQSEDLSELSEDLSEPSDDQSEHSEELSEASEELSEESEDSEESSDSDISEETLSIISIHPKYGRMDNLLHLKKKTKINYEYYIYMKYKKIIPEDLFENVNFEILNEIDYPTLIEIIKEKPDLLQTLTQTNLKKTIEYFKKSRSLLKLKTPFMPEGLTKEFGEEKIESYQPETYQQPLVKIISANENAHFLSPDYITKKPKAQKTIIKTEPVLVLPSASLFIPNIPLNQLSTDENIVMNKQPGESEIQYSERIENIKKLNKSGYGIDEANLYSSISANNESMNTIYNQGINTIVNSVLRMPNNSSFEIEKKKT